MAVEASVATRAPQRRFAQFGRHALLVPEGVLIFVLLLIYFLSNGSSLVALLISLLIIWFVARIAALHAARAMLERARYSEAQALLHVASVFYPFSADTLALRGTLALITGAPEQAAPLLRRAIRLMPGQPHYHTGLSNALLDLGRAFEAAQAARNALTLDERCALAYLALAEAEQAAQAAAYAVEGQLRAGLAVANTPETTAALQCALAAHLFGERRLAEGMLALHTAEALLSRCRRSRQAELRFFLGELLTAQGHVERAREHFQGVERLDPQGRYAAAAWRGARL